MTKAASTSAPLAGPPYPGAAVPSADPGDFRFPDGFLWGAQTAATQVEGGGIDNNMVEWARSDPKHVADGSVPLPGCDHWNRLEEDYADLKRNGHNSHAFTIDWSRIEPVEGQFDAEALEHYSREIDICRANGMEPIITLLHYAIPNWLTPKGGILSPDTPQLFERFSRYVVERVGDRVTWWSTLNEPSGLAALSYMQGLWPPGESSLFKYFAANGATLRMHAAAARAIRDVQNRHGRKSMISIAHNLRPMHPFRWWNPFDWLLAKIPDYFVNRWFMNSVKAGRSLFSLGGGEEIKGLKGSLDYIGLNYYTRDLIKFKPGGPQYSVADVIPVRTTPATEYPIDVTYDPDGLYETAANMWGQFKLPIMITENGVADRAQHDANGILVDQLQPRYIIDHAAVMHHLIAKGVNVIGYLHWTDWDNWEWMAGWRPKFGLFSFDHVTGRREAKFSASVFQTLATRNAIPAQWLTAENRQNPAERDRFARQAAEQAGIVVDRPDVRTMPLPTRAPAPRDVSSAQVPGPAAVVRGRRRVSAAVAVKRDAPATEPDGVGLG